MNGHYSATQTKRDSNSSDVHHSVAQLRFQHIVWEGYVTDTAMHITVYAVQSDALHQHTTGSFGLIVSHQGIRCPLNGRHGIPSKMALNLSKYLKTKFKNVTLTVKLC